MTLFRMVELEEGMPVQFVGNYVLRANEPPKYGFIEVDEAELQDQLANAAASEVDAVQGRQECEAELREARERNEALEAALPVIWRAFDGLYGAKHKQPIPYDSLPKDRQELFDAALDVLAELNEEAAR